MELDEFKVYWKKIQEQENEQQKHTTKNLEEIVMKTTHTLAEIQRKNTFWNQYSKAVCSALIAVMLVNLALISFLPAKITGNSFSHAILWVSIMILFAFVTMWLAKKTEQIFNIDTSKNLKETLKEAITNYKKLYLLSNIIYFFLFPAYFCAMIKLFFEPIWGGVSISTISWVCGSLTIVSLIINYIYYKIKYFKRIKIMEDNLNELGD